MGMRKRDWIGLFLFISVFGTLGHFVYDLTGQIPVVGLFVPVNESVWEHLKLLFFPAILWTGMKWYKGGFSEAGFWEASLEGIWVGTAAIPSLFYTYSGILGFSLPPVDIAIFYISAFWCSCVAAHRFYKIGKSRNKICQTILLVGTLLLLFGFWIFTFQPPALGIFEKP